MEKLEIRQEILSALDQLSKKQLKHLLIFIKSLLYRKADKEHGIMRLAGTIDKEDLKLMEAAIEDGCEQIDSNEW
ncbi:MAG: hypothetical protein WD048_08410 [Chitinophagales bacterium]